MNNYRISKLPNGIRIATEKIDYVNSFSLGFWFNVGSRDETKKNNGISHLIEHMIFKGTEKRSAKKISQEIESLGGYLNAFTSKEQTCYYGRGMKQHLGKTFEVLADMIQNSVISEKELGKESKVVIDELRDIEDNPEELIFDKFETGLFRGNTLSYPIIGTEKNISSFTRDDLLNYIDTHYTNNNLFIIASGNVEHEKIVELAEIHITKLKNKKKQSRKNFKDAKRNDHYLFKDIYQSHLIMGVSTFGYNRKERAVSNMLSNILGEGSSSRLFQSLRENNGIAYQVNTFMNSFYDVSTLGVYISTNEEMISKAIKIINRELDKLQNKPITKTELNRAKEYIKCHVQMSLESTTNRMMRMGYSMVYFNKIKTIEESIAEVNSVHIEDVKALSERLFDKSNITSVLISSKNYLIN